MLFEPGLLTATPGAIDALEAANCDCANFLTKHLCGDWGVVNEDDKAANNASVLDGSRILSAYRLSTGVKIWIITEAKGDDGRRIATTILLPSEY